MSMKNSVKTFVAICTALMLLPIEALAQQALGGGSKIVSPEIHENNTVTFRLRAPKAVKVQVMGDCIPKGVADLVENKEGVWEYTTPEALKPELYGYSFLVDGLKMNDPSNVYMIRDVNTITNVFIIGGERADFYKVNDVPHGTVSKVWYESATAGFDRRLSVYTPAGYEQNKKQKYPVLYVLHGIGGDEDAWIAQGRAAQILDNLIAKGEAKPMIVVFTNGNISQEAAPGENSTGYTRPTMDLPQTMEGTFETAFPEIVKFIDSNYRTIAKKQSRAICGLSMGGFHTLYISVNNPDMFGYSGMFSAAIGVSDSSVSPIYQDFDQKLATYFSKKPSLLWIGCGNTDFLIQANREFVQKLNDNKYPHEYYENSDGHIWRNWRIYLTEFVPKLF